MSFQKIVKSQLNSAPITTADLTKLQTQVKHAIPTEYINLLKIADGGLWQNKRVIMYSCGNSMPADDQVLAANNNRSDAPLFFIGRFSEDEFGYRLEGLSTDTDTIFVLDHETDEIHEVATDLMDFFEKFSKPAKEKKKKWYSFLFS